MYDTSTSLHHLPLDIETLSTTNVKMKNLNFFTGFIIIGLLTQNGIANLKAHRERAKRETYLPLSVTSPKKTIREEIITIHQEKPKTPKKFDESKYGNGKYQIFEVHSQYAPKPKILEYNAPGYLPPDDKIHVKHVLNVPNSNINQLDVSSTNYIERQAAAPPAPSTAFSSNYQQPFQKPPSNPGHSETIFHVEHIHTKSVQPYVGNNRQQQQQDISQGTQNSIHQNDKYVPPHLNEIQHEITQTGFFKGRDYLPPHHSVQHRQHQYQHQHHESLQQAPQKESTFRGPYYLPPLQTSVQQNQQNYFPPHGNDEESGYFKGPDLLSSHQISSSNGHFQGQNYLPPHYNDINSNQPEAQHQQSGQWRGLDYFAPKHNDVISNQIETQHQNVQQSREFKGPDYLPPIQVQNNNQFNGNDNFPPYHNNVNFHQNDIQPQQVQQSGQFRGPSYLPPHQSYQDSYNNELHIQAKERNYLPPYQLSRTSLGTHKAQDPLQPLQTKQQPHHHQTEQEHFEQSPEPRTADSFPPFSSNNQLEDLSKNFALQQTAPTPRSKLEELVSQLQPIQALSEPIELPLGYDFEKPANAEQAIAELHTLPEEDNQQMNSLQTQQTQNNEPRESSAINQRSESQTQQGSATNFNQNTPQIFLPAPEPSDKIIPPFARPVQAEQYSAISAVTDNAVSAPKQQQNTAPLNPSVSPTQALRAGNDAHITSQPTERLETTINQLENHENQKSDHSLQQFIPQENPQSYPDTKNVRAQSVVEHTMPSPVSVNRPTSSRVRTVQILSSSTVKTLKVIETSDQSGVKTIKILGPTQTQPTGEHRIIKVVTKNLKSPQEHVQTVKIYNNDDVTSNDVNTYLPPVAQTSPSQPQENHQKSFTENHRYRYLTA